MNTDEKVSWLESLLSGWGVKQSWAKIIAGAVIGALAAAGLLTSGCTATVNQTQADGTSTSGTISIVIPDTRK